MKETRARRARAHKPVRRATSLVELTAVMAVTVSILAIMAASLRTIYNGDRTLRDHLAMRAAVSRISIQLRADAHAATAADVTRSSDTPALPQLTLTSRDAQQIQYVFHDDRLQRLVKHDDRIAHREAFRLAENTKVDWSVQQAERGQILDLRIRTPLEREESENPMIIRAIVGLDHGSGAGFQLADPPVQGQSNE